VKLIYSNLNLRFGISVIYLYLIIFLVVDDILINSESSFD
jgi:hypothetical protein